MDNTPMSSLRRLLATPHGCVALYFGTGLSPWMPGTVATLATIPLYLVLQLLPGSVYGGFLAVAFVLGVVACERTTRAIGVHDHRAIVWDEVVGFLITMALVPATPLTVGAGFVLFRVFDVFKPWPIRWLDERIHGGMGIMLDDVAAGVASAACLTLGYRIVSGA